MENFPNQTTPGTPPEQSGSMQDPGEQSGSMQAPGEQIDPMQASSETGNGLDSNGVDRTGDDVKAENRGFSAAEDDKYFGNYAAAEAAEAAEEMVAFPGWYESGTEQEPIQSVNPAEYQGAAVPENPANPNPPVILQSPENPIATNEPNTVTGQQPTPGAEIKEA